MNGMVTVGLDDIRVEEVPFEAGHEGEFQSVIETHPRVLPIQELNPPASTAVPIGREVSTNVGSIDLVFLDNTGRLLLLECKLVANPEARREVIAQLIEYSSHIRWDVDRVMALAAEYEQRASLADVVTRLRESHAASAEPPDLDRNTLKRKIAAGLKSQTRSPMLVVMSDRLEQRALVLADALRRLKVPIACVEIRRFRFGSGYVLVGSARAASLLVTLSPSVRTAIDEETWLSLVGDEPIHSIRQSLLDWVQELRRRELCDVTFGSKELGVVVKSSLGNQKLASISEERLFLYLTGFRGLGWSSERVEQVRRDVETAIGPGALSLTDKFPSFSLRRLENRERLEALTQVLGSHIASAAGKGRTALEKTSE